MRHLVSEGYKDEKFVLKLYRGLRKACLDPSLVLSSRVHMARDLSLAADSLGEAQLPVSASSDGGEPNDPDETLSPTASAQHNLQNKQAKPLDPSEGSQSPDATVQNDTPLLDPGTATSTGLKDPVLALLDIKRQGYSDDLMLPAQPHTGGSAGV